MNRKIDQNMSRVWPNYLSIIRLLCEQQIHSLKKLQIQPIGGIPLCQTLPPNSNIIHINIYLQTIDDLFILLNGLLPNVQIMIVKICQNRLLKYRCFPNDKLSLQLTEFSLVESSIGLITNDMKWIWGFMPNLNKLTLSIRDTPDPLFCHGPNLESILTEFLPNLQQFDYTMTHQITENSMIEDFVRWPMSIVNYQNDNRKYVHIYSLPWPSTKDDQRDLTDESIKSHINTSRYRREMTINRITEVSGLERDYPRVRQLRTCLSIDIQLPQQIYKLILGEETPESSINNLIQPSIHHLIIKRRLNTIEELSNYARQFPHVKYLELLLPDEKSLFIDCFKSLFSFDDQQNKRCYWSKLISFSTPIGYRQLEFSYRGTNLHLWLIENTDLKHASDSFHINYPRSIFSIWF